MSSISVVLCTFNGELYIKQQIESILGQKPQPDELIICDDCSTDNTLKIISGLSKDYPAGSIKVFRNESNMGFIRNFQQGLQLCCGDYVFFSDQDDVWMPEKVRDVIDFFNKNPKIEMVFTDGYLIDKNGNRLKGTLWSSLGFSGKQRRRFRNNPLEYLLGKNIVTGATVAIKRTIIDSVVPFPEELVHDTWIAYVSAIRGSIGIIEEPLIQYRLHSTQTIGIRHGISLNQLSSADKNEELSRLSVVYDYANRIGYIECIKMIQEKKDFFVERRSLASKKIIERVKIVISNRNNYYLYASGLLSMFKDILFG